MPKMPDGTYQYGDTTIQKSTDNGVPVFTGIAPPPAQTTPQGSSIPDTSALRQQFNQSVQNYQAMAAQIPEGVRSTIQQYMPDYRNPPQPSMFSPATYWNDRNQEAQQLRSMIQHGLTTNIPGQRLTAFDLYTSTGEKGYDVPEGTISVTQVFMPERKFYLLQYNRRMKLRVWSGCPSAYSTDAAQQRLILHPIPDQVYHLVVSRAYVPDAVDVGDDIPLPEEYAMAISDWIAYRALRNNDADGSNVLNADLFMRSWYEALRDLKRETIRFLAGDDPSAQPRRWS